MGSNLSIVCCNNRIICLAVLSTLKIITQTTDPAIFEGITAGITQGYYFLIHSASISILAIICIITIVFDEQLIKLHTQKEQY